MSPSTIIKSAIAGVSLIALTAYEAVRRWNGILCPVNSTCVYGENQTPFLNLGR